MARKIQRAAYIKFGRVMRAALRALWQRTSMKLQRWWYRMIAVIQTTLRARRLRLALLVQGKYLILPYQPSLSPHPLNTSSQPILLTHSNKTPSRPPPPPPINRLVGEAEGLRGIQRRRHLPHPAEKRHHHPAGRPRVSRTTAAEEETRLQQFDRTGIQGSLADGKMPFQPALLTHPQHILLSYPTNTPNTF